MLSRTADSLFWLARYNERAGNVARGLGVTLRTAGMSAGLGTENGEWHALLVATGGEETFFRKHPSATQNAVVDWLVHDPDNASSIGATIEAARRNGRAVRTALTVDMWEALNDTWNRMRELLPDAHDGEALAAFLSWVRERVLLFNGAAHDTMLREEAWRFVHLGTMLERADNTARLLDVKHHLLAGQTQWQGQNGQWQSGGTQGARMQGAQSEAAQAQGAQSQFQSQGGGRRADEAVAPFAGTANPSTSGPAEPPGLDAPETPASGTTDPRASGTMESRASGTMESRASGTMESRAPGTMDYIRWQSILNSVSALRAYQRVFHDRLDPKRIAELLILRPELPRSLLACMTEVANTLDAIAEGQGGRRGECHRLAGALHARLRYGRIEAVLAQGLHEFLTEIIEQGAVLGVEIERFYIRP